MRILILLIYSCTFPITALAFQWESISFLERQASSHIYELGDSLLEFSYRHSDLTFTYCDTFSQITSQIIIDPTVSTSDRIKTIISLGNRRYKLAVNQYLPGLDEYTKPYFYCFDTGDTGLIEERFRVCDLPQGTYLIDASPIQNGGFMVLYTIGDNPTWWRVSRVSDAGDILWTESIIEDPLPYGITRAIGMCQSTTDPSQYYIFSQIHHSPPGPFFAQVTSIDTSGSILWVEEYQWPGGVFGYEVTEMESFNDGTYGIVGTGSNVVVYLHISVDGENLGIFTYWTDKLSHSNTTHSLVVGGERLLVLAEFENDDEHTVVGLIYMNEEGDSLESHMFHPDTVTTHFQGPMLLRPDGKVMLWVHGYYWDRRNQQIDTDILYTLYPDGRPGMVDEPFDILPATLSLSCAPNPFNSTLTLRIQSPHAIAGGVGGVFLRIYDISGRLVADLLSGVTPALRESASRSLRPEAQSLTWDASSSPAGVYFVRLQSGADIVTQKVVLMR